MKLKAVTGMMLTLLITSMLTIAFNVAPIVANPSVAKILDYPMHARASNPTTVTLEAIADSYVKSSSPDSNYGNEASIKTEITTGAIKNYTYTYVMFNLSSIPSDAVIRSANLSLYMTGYSGVLPHVGGTIEAHYCSDTSWIELGITWNNKPPFDPERTSYVRFGIAPPQKYYDWNVTSDVSRALSNGKLTEVVKWYDYTNPDVYGIARFQSKEAALNPKLTVKYLRGTEEEIAYDDGTIEEYTWWEGAGGIFAVRFTSPVSGQLKRCPFYIYSDPAAVKIHVMNSEKNDVITPFTYNVTGTGWINVDLLAYGVSVSSGVDFYIGLEWTMAGAPTLGVDLSSPDSRSWKWNGVEWSLRSDGDYMIRAIVEVEGEDHADIDVDPMHLDFYAQASTSTPACARENCCCPPCDNRTAYPIMHPDRETLQEWVKLYNSAPRAYIDSEFVPSTGSFSLLDYLEYIPSERDQESCGNCWVWTGTGVFGVALDVQEVIKDRLSVQYFTSCWHGGTANDWACCGGTLGWFADWYQDNGFAIPWSNTNAHWQDGNRRCEDGTSVPCHTISTLPNYTLSRCVDETIETHGLGQAQAIANIKNVLHQNKSIYFSFSLPNSDDWNVFFDFWNTEPESAVWSPDYSCGHTYVDLPNEGGGHAVLCVGYNDTDPNNSYWIMVNSWGTAGGSRPNGIFHVDMNINYDCWLNSFGYSLKWQTLDVDFEVRCQPITISNVGNADLEVTSIECDQPWLSVSPPCPPSFTVPPGENQTVSVCVDPTGLSAGVYYGNTLIYSNDPDENPFNVTVTLSVEEISWTVTIDPNGGRVYVDGTPVTTITIFLWESGSTHILDPDSGYQPHPGTMLEFLQWEDGNTQDPRNITVESNFTYEVIWQTKYELTIETSPSEGGYTDPSVGSYWYNETTSVNVTAFPNIGYTFGYWLLDEVNAGSDNPITVSMDTPHRLVAMFTAIPPHWYCSINATGTNGYTDIVVFGEHVGASDGQDIYDVPKPPPGPPPSLYMYSVESLPTPYDKLQENWKYGPDSFKEWVLKIYWQDAQSTTITLTWNFTATDFEYTSIILYDPVTGNIVDMQQQNGYQFDMDVGSKELHIICSYKFLISKLQTGWNLISSLSTDNITKNDFQVYFDGTWYTWNEAVTSNIVMPYIYYYDGNRYIVADQFEPGKGYWIYAYVDFELWGEPYIPSEDFIASLQTGWSLIGLPCNASISLDSLWIYYNGEWYTWDEAVANGIIMPYVYCWDGEKYITVNQLEPGKGYWTYAYVDCEIYWQKP